MVEWFKAAVLKTAEGRPSVGSNPTSSASFVLKQTKKSRSKAKSKIASKSCNLLFLLLSRILLCCPQRSVIFLWGCRGLTPTGSLRADALASNPTSSAIFLPKKWRTKTQVFTSLCRQAQLHSKNKVFSSLLHKIPEALLVKSLPVVACEEVSLCCP